MITIVELREYIRNAEKLLTQDERTELINHIAQHPTAGVLLSGTNGVRKLRWKRKGIGKSGGVRVVYYYYSDKVPLFLLTVFGKSGKENLTKAERNELAKLTKLLIDYYGKNV